MATQDLEPNQWTVTSDFTKVIVTLAGALLGVTVTLAAQLIGKADVLTQWALYITWALSGLAIAVGVASHGFVVGRLRGKFGDGLPILAANISYWSLVLAAIAFAVFGAFAVTRRPSVTAAAIVETAITSLPTLSGDKASNWKLKSLVFDSGTSVYDVVMVKDGANDTFTLTLNSNGEIVKARQP